MKMIKNILSLFLLMSVLCSCDALTGGGDQRNPQDQRTSGQLLQRDGSLEGTGQIIFSNSLGPIRGAKSFELVFELEDGGSLEVMTYATSLLQNGVGFKAQRLGDQLEVVIKGRGVEQAFYEPFAEIDPSSQIHLLFDSHNNHDDANHLLIWKYRAAGGYSLGNVLLNSDFFKLPRDLDGLDFTDWHDFGVKGAGAFWGMRLDRAKVHSYKVDRAVNND